MNNFSNSNIFRKSSIGKCLEETLSLMNRKEELPEDVNSLILSHFEKSISFHLKNSAKLPFVDSIGGLKHYQRCDNDWKLQLENAEFVTEGGEIVRSSKIDVFGVK
ncbi:Gtf2a2p [Bonamia ostreae]|uniref:Gtf2a2p n=1 Tax=Bonamia ostreae TaxID=126728 RepID=A0ABV2AHF7_9EUKA